MIDSLEAEGFGPLGGQVLQVLDCAAAGCAARAVDLRERTAAVVVGVDYSGALPALDPAPFDALLTTAPHAPAPWTSVPAARLEQRLATIGGIVGRAPIAASVAMEVLRMTGALPFDAAITLESLAYSALLGGAEFRAWRESHPVSGGDAPGGPLVSYEREGDVVTITLDQPRRRNALCAAMRDALFEALAAVADDPSQPALLLQGRGACFSTGGDLAEFGLASDLAAAHAVRTARSCARLLHRLCNRTAMHFHGACIGSGVEIGAAAGSRIGRPGTFFQLPELTMGLMPGAGGTVTLPRAIGRHRTASMLLTARRVDAATALDWGLLTELEGS